jgi:hypothetical protein
MTEGYYMKKRSKNSDNQQPLFPTFGAGFLQDHAGLIVSNPNIAIVELVANSWDAGADLVQIRWPDSVNGQLTIEDNGTGMTFEEFSERWLELSYNRVEAQGDDVVFPLVNRTSKRKAFGRNGKGRHSMFCFSDEYRVETWRNGIANVFAVTRQYREFPFQVKPLEEFEKEGSGTIISGDLLYHHIPINDLASLIASKFIADPSFEILINDTKVELTDLRELSETQELQVEDLGEIKVHLIDSQRRGRTSKQHGVAWWVNKRLVGDFSWRGYDDNLYLDARTSEAKRYTFVVEADILLDQVKADWSDFLDTEVVKKVQDIAKEYILGRINELFKNVRRERKVEALSNSKDTLKDLSPVARYNVGSAIDQIQSKSPTITQRDLTALVEVMSTMEQSRSKYSLLGQLSKLDSADIDGLNRLLETWTVTEALIVMDELDQRLKLISTLSKLVEDPSADELHEIHPLIGKGLWIFGPEYEAISFLSNRTLNTIIEGTFGGAVVPLKSPKRRPDYIALPNSTLGVYASDSYDDRGEVWGFDKVLIVELKRGGFEISRKERQQAGEYANEIRKGSRVSKSTQIIGFVLGAKISDDAVDSITEGPMTTIYTRTYEAVIRQAHARTFNLQKRLEEVNKEYKFQDAEVEIVLNTLEQKEFPL